MKLEEMEPKIDMMGLKKLEVKMRRAHEVDYFICTTRKVHYDDGESAFYGELIVFENNGHAWRKTMTKWWEDDGFDIKVWQCINGHERMLTINDYQMQRAPEYDIIERE